MSGFVFNLYLFSWNMVEPSDSFYTVEGGGTFWNMVDPDDRNGLIDWMLYRFANVANHLSSISSFLLFVLYSSLFHLQCIYSLIKISKKI